MILAYSFNQMFRDAQADALVHEDISDLGPYTWTLSPSVKTSTTEASKFSFQMSRVHQDTPYISQNNISHVVHYFNYVQEIRSHIICI